MNSTATAVYIALTIHFLRKIRRKLSPDNLRAPREATKSPCDVLLSSIPIVTCATEGIARKLVDDLAERGLGCTWARLEGSHPHSALVENEIAMYFHAYILDGIRDGKYRRFGVSCPDIWDRVKGAAFGEREGTL